MRFDRNSAGGVLVVGIVLMLLTLYAYFAPDILRRLK
jgi:hypothetical protein